MYAVTQNIFTGKFALVGGDGQRFDFPADDGPILADLFSMEWPACESCEEREKCDECGQCPDCYCDCEEDQDDEGQDEDEQATN